MQRSRRQPLAGISSQIEVAQASASDKPTSSQSQDSQSGCELHNGAITSEQPPCGTTLRARFVGIESWHVGLRDNTEQRLQESDQLRERERERESGSCRFELAVSISRWLTKHN